MIRTSHYLFAALCLGSLFVYSRQFTDSYIVPKWCFVVFILLVILVYEAVNILFGRQNKQKDIGNSVYGFIIVTACFLQAIFGVVLFFGFPKKGSNVFVQKVIEVFVKYKKHKSDFFRIICYVTDSNIV